MAQTKRNKEKTSPMQNGNIGSESTINTDESLFSQPVQPDPDQPIIQPDEPDEGGNWV